MLAPESIEERRRSPDPGRLDGLSKRQSAPECHMPESEITSFQSEGGRASSRLNAASTSAAAGPRPIRGRTCSATPDTYSATSFAFIAGSRTAATFIATITLSGSISSRAAARHQGNHAALSREPSAAQMRGKAASAARGRARRPPGRRRASGPPRVRRGCDHASGRRGSLSPRRIARARGGATASGGARRRSGGHKGFRNPGREAVARNRPPRMR